MATIIPYDRLLQKRIDKAAERIKRELDEDHRRRVNDLLGRLNKELEDKDS